jgi:hypothetical protein
VSFISWFQKQWICWIELEVDLFIIKREDLKGDEIELNLTVLNFFFLHNGDIVIIVKEIAITVSINALGRGNQMQ